MRGFRCDPFEEDNSANPEQGLPETLGCHAGTYEGDSLAEKKLFDFACPRAIRKKQKSGVLFRLRRGRVVADAAADHTGSGGGIGCGVDEDEAAGGAVVGV